jgi:hypothetical protein
VNVKESSFSDFPGEDSVEFRPQAIVPAHRSAS